MTRNEAAKFRNAGFDRDKLVIASVASIKNTAGAAATAMTGSIVFAKAKKVLHRVDDIALATLRTDDAGRLIVVGGPGISASPANTKLESFADNDGWYDSVSDGPVSATLRIGNTSHPVIPAWVTVTVPRYAPEVYGIITWFDQALNMARTGADGTFNPPRTTSFLHDVYPILKRADDVSAVQFTVHGKGGDPLTSPERLKMFQGDGEARKSLLNRLTQPNAAADNFQVLPGKLMPKLYSGANPDPKGPKFVFLVAHALSARSSSALGAWRLRERLARRRAEADGFRKDPRGPSAARVEPSRPGSVRRRLILPRHRGYLRHRTNQHLPPRAPLATGVSHRPTPAGGKPL